MKLFCSFRDDVLPHAKFQYLWLQCDAQIQDGAGCQSGMREFLAMLDYLKTWVELRTDRRAVTALEYALIAGVIVATILVGFNVLASGMSNEFSNIGGSL
jgi:Flp pilus assembly pilin Flp